MIAISVRTKGGVRPRALGVMSYLGVLCFMNRLLSVVRSRTDKSLELSRAALTVPRYGESNRLVGVD